MASRKVSEFRIHGMDCAEEIAALKRELGPIEGVNDLAFDLLNAKMIVTFEGTHISNDSLIVAVKRTGLRAELWSPHQSEEASSTFWARNERSILTISSAFSVALGFSIHVLAQGLRAAISEESELLPLGAKLSYAAAIVTGSWLVLPKAWISLKKFRPDMNLLMMTAIAGAVIIGQWFEGATVALLFAVSILLEAWSVSRARRAVSALMALAPPKARVIHAEHGKLVHEHLMDISEVKVGCTILVRPGEKFPLDGKISKGQTTVNQAPITGESVPVYKAIGDEIYAGTINEDGAVEFVTSKLSGETTIANIVKMVSQAQNKRSQSEQWVEKFAKYYTPLVMILAIIVMVLPPLLGNGSWAKWFYEGLVLLVIACPCALVISTPVSIVAALASAAKNGVLIKGGIYLELPSKIRAFAMDKTGTLTQGNPTVGEVIPLSGHTEHELIEIASAIEANSEHPLARAIMKHAASLGVKVASAENYKAIKGKGASATLKGNAVWIGSHKYLEERGQETQEMHDKLESLSAMGSSVVVIGNGSHVCGFIAVSDQLRSNAHAAVQALHANGIEHIVMLTGDNYGTAQVIGKQSGVDEVKAELLPEDKVKAIEGLVAKYGTVAMIGDGVNDAPAMARASLGIAMGAAGTDAAIETADIALMSDDLSKIPWLVSHSKRTMGIIRQNIAASLVVKAVFVGLSFMGISSMWGAIAADMGISLAVVINALRLLSVR